MSLYTAITFAPVQGFIEKSRKLRDLFGASLILSYLSYRLVKKASETPGAEVISPGAVNIQKGMPNRILLRGAFSQDEAKNILLGEWKAVLKECRVWVQDQLKGYTYSWEREWTNW